MKEKRILELLTYRHDMGARNVRFGKNFKQVGHDKEFHWVLTSDQLIAYPTSENLEVDEGIKIFEPFLRGWELEAELKDGNRFKFGPPQHRAITRNKTGHITGQIFSVGTASEVNMAGEVWVTHTRSRMSAPAGPLPMTTPLVTMMLERWRLVADGKEKLTVNGYWMLSKVEEEFGEKEGDEDTRRRRQIVADRLNIRIEVLNKVGDITAINDPIEGRKAKGEPRKITPAETNYLHACIPKIILRVANLDQGSDNLPEITLADLPDLGARSQ